MSSLRSRSERAAWRLASGWALLLSLVGLTFLSLLPAPAAAQNERALINQGMRMRRAERYEEALELFRRAYEAGRSPQALAQVGLAEASLERWIEAEEHLLHALSNQDDEWISSRREALENGLNAIREHIGSMRLTGGTRGADVVVDDRVRGRLPLAEPVRLGEGEHRVEIRMAERIPLMRPITIEGQEELHLTVPALRGASSDCVAGEQPSGGDALSHTWLPGWIMFIGGAAAAGIGAGLGAYAMGEREALRDLCFANECPSELIGRRDGGLASAIIADILLFGGGAAAVVGLALAFILAEDPAEASSDQAHLDFSMGCDGAGCGLQLSGDF